MVYGQWSCLRQVLGLSCKSQLIKMFMPTWWYLLEGEKGISGHRCDKYNPIVIIPGSGRQETVLQQNIFVRFSSFSFFLFFSFLFFFFSYSFSFFPLFSFFIFSSFSFYPFFSFFSFSFSFSIFSSFSFFSLFSFSYYSDSFWTLLTKITAQPLLWIILCKWGLTGIWQKKRYFLLWTNRKSLRIVRFSSCLLKSCLFFILFVGTRQRWYRSILYSLIHINTHNL